jgi:hypothetical protein
VSKRRSSSQVEPSIPVTPCLVGAARLDLRAGSYAEAEQLLLRVATSWEHVSPDDPGRGEVLFWLARAEEELGKMAAARREAQLSDSLLRRSTLPAFRRLVEAKPGFR